MKLTNDDVQEILRLLDDSSYDELHLQTENFSLSLRRSGAGEGWTQEPRTYANPDLAKVTQPAAAVTAGLASTDTTREGLLEIRSPMVGTFYRAPKPGADPFVEIGAQVEPETVIAIIEVMKLMNSIRAGVEGEIVELLVEDAQFVEKGQLLMRVKPNAQ